jgi:hypothetical protein
MAQGGLYGNALQAISFGGHEKVVEPGVNAQGGSAFATNDHYSRIKAIGATHETDEQGYALQAISDDAKSRTCAARFCYPSISPFATGALVSFSSVTIAGSFAKKVVS